MAPVMGDLDSNTIITVKHISDKEIVESVCHVAKGSPPKPIPLYQNTQIDKKSYDRRRKTVQLQLPTEKPGCWTDESKHSEELEGEIESMSPKETRNITTKPPVSPSLKPRRKVSESSFASATSTKSSHLLTPDQTRRNTVGTCMADNSPLLQARRKAMNKKLSTTNSSSSNVSQQSSQESLQQLNLPPYDPVKVTNLDIDAGAYFPSHERMDFLREALSVSPVPFLPEQRKKSAESLKIN